MLRAIELKNFKGARDLKVRLSNLTILSGLNSSGKSTLIQALCLLRQSVKRGRVGALQLKGPLVQLGVWQDVHCHGALEGSIGISVEDDRGTWRAEFRSDVDSGIVESVETSGRFPRELASTDFQLLLAERTPPSVTFPQSSGWDALAGRLGANGEFFADVLARSSLDGFKVPKKRRFSVSAGPFRAYLAKVGQTSQLLDQVSLWMQDFSPGARARSERIPGTDDVRLVFDYVGRSGLGESGAAIRPTNVGFGLTYALPVIAAALSARRGSVLLLENPEAHLHPRGQSRLGRLVAQAVSDGVQVIVETHSDHFLNGIRLAVKDRLLSAEHVVCHYFSREIESGDVFVQSPAILSDGSMPLWPDGFFDEWDNALDALLDPK